MLVHILLFVQMNHPGPRFHEFSAFFFHHFVVQWRRHEHVELHVVQFFELEHDVRGVFAFDHRRPDHLTLLFVLFQLAPPGFFAGLVRGVHKFARFRRIRRSFPHFAGFVLTPSRFAEKIRRFSRIANK